MRKPSEIAVLKCMLLADCKTDSIIFHFPMDITPNSISEMKNIFNSFKDYSLEKDYYHGRLSSIEGFLHYYLYPSKLFMVVDVNKLYKEERLKELTSSIDKEIKEKCYLEYKEENFNQVVKLKNEGMVYIAKMFEKYKVLDSNGNINPNRNFEEQDFSDFFLDTVTFSKGKEAETEKNFIQEQEHEDESYMQVSKNY